MQITWTLEKYEAERVFTEETVKKIYQEALTKRVEDKYCIDVFWDSWLTPRGTSKINIDAIYVIRAYDKRTGVGIKASKEDVRKFRLFIKKMIKERILPPLEGVKFKADYSKEELRGLIKDEIIDILKKKLDK
jgi:hypothetical protein